MTGKAYSLHKEPTGCISPSIYDRVRRFKNYCEIFQIVVLLGKQATVLTFPFLSVCPVVLTRQF